MATGPLTGVRVVEFAGIGPAPFCAMLLADQGADVVRLDRLGGNAAGGKREPKLDLLNRGRRSVAVDLKSPAGTALSLDLVEKADVLIEGFRPGVMERLGLGPDVCLNRNPRLVYGRMTGWGQYGPLSERAGHDINFIALSGALHAVGRREGPPVVPLNLVGDFAGGALYLAFGLLSALHNASRTGCGQVVDAAMSDGSVSLMTMFHGLNAMGLWRENRESNYLDGAAPYYTVYEAADGRFIAVGAIEDRFYRELLAGLGIDPDSVVDRRDPANWPALRSRFQDIFATRTRDEWARHFNGRDACVTPVLTLTEAPGDAHHRTRNTFSRCHGLDQPSPAPRFSATPGAIQGPPPLPGAHTRKALADWGIDKGRIDKLLRERAIGEAG
ncbi:CoA transferase [Ferruginivarius sediminum]|uniref:CoA transferase n=1 Tax=Ferruginivarius sediminum TaxID=2661937 RepID=A0A369TBS6_9PROT|nr:CoA transferase [Ferruginivarius sediminum]